MAIRRVWHAATGSGDGSSWANAYTTLAAALAAFTSGDFIYVREDHAETQASGMTLTAPSDPANPAIILCVNSVGGTVGTPTALATTATVTTTSSTNAITYAGFARVYGITFNAIGNHNFSNTSGWGWDITGNLTISGTGTALRLVIGTNGNGRPGELRLNGNISFNGTSQGIAMRGRFIWDGGSLLNANLTGLYKWGTERPSSLAQHRRVDFSVMTGSIVEATDQSGTFIFHNCVRHASSTIAAAPTAHGGPKIMWLAGNPGETGYQQSAIRYEGDEFGDVAVYAGSHGVSRRMVTPAQASQYFPLRSLYPLGMVVPSALVGVACELTIPIVTDNWTPTDADIGARVYYSTDATSPIGALVDSMPALLTSGSALASSSVTWTGTGGFTSEVKREIVVPFTPERAGPIVIEPWLAIPSKTAYVAAYPTLAAA